MSEHILFQTKLQKIEIKQTNGKYLGGEESLEGLLKMNKDCNPTKSTIDMIKSILFFNS